MPRSAPAAVLSLLLLSATACDSLSEFKGTFSGSVVKGSFVRSCFSAETRAKLTFHPSAAVSRAVDAGAGANWLTLSAEDEVVFDAALDPIESLSSDALADFDFPGQKRLRNFMLMARSEQGPLAGRDVLVVVSLLADKQVEVRVIGRGADDAPPCEEEGDSDSDAETPRAPEYYGLFKLK